MAIPTYEGKYILYTSRIKSGMNGSPLLEATEVADLAQNKLQSEVNAETLTALGDRYTKAEADKKISDAVAAGGSYTLPIASSSALGGVKPGTSTATIAGVFVDSKTGVMGMNLATPLISGAMSAADKTKLDTLPETWTAMKDEIKGYVDSQTDGIAALEARIAALEAALTLK